MKNRTHHNRLFAVLAGVICTLALLSARAQTYTWVDNAQGQPYLVCPSGLGPETNFFPSNNLWTQSVQTNGNCNNTASVESAPSNWDPAPPIGIYPGGPGLVGVDVVIGAPASTKLNAVVTLNSLTIETNGVLGISGSSGVTANHYDFQGDGTLSNVGTTGGTPAVVIANGGTMVKSGGTNVFGIVGMPLLGTNNTIEVDSGTLAFPSGFGDANLDGGTFAVSNNATLLLTVDSGSTPELAGNFTGVGGGTVLFNNGALMGSWSFNLPGSMFQWTGGTLEATCTNNGVFNLANSLGFHGSRLYNNGLVNLADNSSLNCSSTGGAINNNLGATFNIQGNSSILNGGLFGFNNYGLLTKSAGAGTAQITMGLNNYGGTVEVDAGTMALNGIEISNATFVVSNGATLDLATVPGNFEIDGTLTGSGGGTILMNNGTVFSVFPTTFNFPGSMFQWAGGKLGDTASNTEVNLGTINVSGPVAIDGNFANSGAMIQSGTGSIGSGNFLYNYTNALYDIQDDAGISVGNLINYGLVRKSAGTNTSVITGTFINYGSNAVLEVDTGILALAGIGGNYFTNSTLAISNAATLDLGAVPSVNQGTEVEGYFNGTNGGTLLMTNGTLLCNLPTSVNFPGSMFQWLGGRIGAANNNMTNIGTLNIGGSVGINNFLVNSGTMTQSGNGAITSGNQLQNNAGGLYDIQNDNGISISHLNNYALIRKSAGTNNSILTTTLLNYGPIASLEVDSGVLTLAGNGGNFFTNTTVVISNSATLDLSAVTSVNPATEVEGFFNGSGGGTLLMTNGTLLCNQPTTVNFPGSMFQWLGGRIGGGNNNMTNVGTLNIGGPVSINTFLVNSGKMIQSGNGAITGGNQLQNNVSGVYNIQNDNGVSATTFNNFGLCEKTSGTGISIITPNFNNSGAIKATSGMLLFTNGTFVQNAGTLQLSSSVSCQGAITENGGTITGVGPMGNTGPVGMTVNGGVVAPGNPFGALSWIGHFGYSMSSPAAFSVVLGGSNLFGQLQVPNTTATIAGTLNVTLTNGYAPPIGTQFQIISASSRGGTFSKLNVPQGISVTYSNTGVFLVVTGTVPVEINQPQITGTNFTFGFGTISNQSYTIQQNTDLSTTNWLLYTNFIGDGSFFQCVTPAASPAQNFFRVRQP